MTCVLLQLTVRAYDSGTPAREDFELVRVTVDQNLNPPEFVTPSAGQNYQNTTEILETRAVNSVFYTVVTRDLDASVSFRLMSKLCPLTFLVLTHPFNSLA